MHLEYVGPLSIKHEWCRPNGSNGCRLFVATNVVNYFRGENILTTQLAFEIFERDRFARGLPSLNLDEVCLEDEEVDHFIDVYGGDIGDLPLEGRRFMDLSLWRDLIDAGFLIVPDHQMLYYDPKQTPKRTGLFHFSPDLVSRAVFEETFSYQTFRELYSQFISMTINLEEGHVDIVLDIREVNGVICIILANYTAGENVLPLAIPWNFFKNYLALDWSMPVLTDISELPSEVELAEIKELGSLDIGANNFFYGAFDIYHPKARRPELDAILARHHLTSPSEANRSFSVA